MVPLRLSWPALTNGEEVSATLTDDAGNVSDRHRQCTRHHRALMLVTINDDGDSVTVSG